MELLQERRYRLGYAAFGVVVAWTLGALLGAPVGLSLNNGLWFEILILILLSAFILEFNFSGAPAAMVNSVAAILLTLGARFTGPRAWWISLTVSAVVATLLLVVDFALRDPQAPTDTRGQRVARVARQVATTLGSWRFVLIAALALTLVAFNEPFDDAWTVSAIVVLYALAVSKLPPHRLAAMLSGHPRPGDSGIAAARIYAPTEILLTGPGVDGHAPGDCFTLSGSERTIEAVALSPTYFRGRQAIRVFARDLSTVLTRADAEDLEVVPLERGEADPPHLQPYLEQMRDSAVRVVGTVSEGTAIFSLTVEVFPGEVVRTGELVWSLAAGQRLFWQVFDAQVDRTTWGGDTRRVVSARCTQLGYWHDDVQSFVALDESPRETDLVFSGTAGPTQQAVPVGVHSIGYVPGSNFPVMVNLRELTLHHTAILGTTGTGKTHLAFGLVEAMAASGVKVVCVDTTGQYARRFPHPVAMAHTIGTLHAFLQGDDQIAVVSPDPNRHTVFEGNDLAEAALIWCRSQPPLKDVQPARVVILFEEAQNFVPEGFVVDGWDLKAKAQDTSRIIMESRKFGLGFILVSQRTAMVTKSALSQCNTIHDPCIPSSRSDRPRLPGGALRLSHGQRYPDSADSDCRLYGARDDERSPNHRPNARRGDDCALILLSAQQLPASEPAAVSNLSGVVHQPYLEEQAQVTQ